MYFRKSTDWAFYDSLWAWKPRYVYTVEMQPDYNLCYINRLEVLMKIVSDLAQAKAVYKFILLLM